MFLAFLDSAMENKWWQCNKKLATLSKMLMHHNFCYLDYTLATLWPHFGTFASLCLPTTFVTHWLYSTFPHHTYTFATLSIPTLHTTHLFIKNAPHLLHFGYTPHSHTIATLLLHFPFPHFDCTNLLIKNVPHL